jgi:protein phosphatase
MFVFHVGDSRAYLFRQGVLERLTRDQTMVQALVESGYITPEQAKTHRLRHVLTGVMGGKAGHDTPEVQMLRLQHADRLLLCTDGLTEMVEDSSIAEVLRRSESPAIACQSLLERALQAGGKDNVTVVVADYSLPIDTTA